jgi:hypothetical protein
MIFGMIIVTNQNKINSDDMSTIKYRFRTIAAVATTSTTTNTPTNSSTSTPTPTSTSKTTTNPFFILSIVLFFSLSLSLSTITNSNMATTSTSTSTSTSTGTAFAQSPNNNNNNGIYSTFPNNSPDTDRAPAFLDAYWTNYLSSSSTASNTNAVKKEVGPGDGSSTLAVVLVNSGRSDITGVTGYLNMPSSGGFTTIAGKNNGTSQSVASAYSIVKAGDTFALYFDMNVLKQAKVGGYSTTLTLKYTKINQIGQLATTITVPFRLTGKVILDAVSENSQLIPSTPNPVKILIKNKGTATASGVVVTVTGITSTTSTTSSSSTNSAASSAASSSTSNTTNTSSSSSPSPSSSSSTPSSSTASSAVNIGPTTFNIGTLPANSSTPAEITPIVYPSTSAGETAQNMNIQITYGDAYGNQQTSNIPIGLVILPNPPQSVLNVTSNNGNALTITAGKIQDMNLILSNSDAKNPITNVVASLDSSSGSIKILGDSRWTFPSMSPQSKIILPTKVFASSTVVGSPAVFTLTVDYISAGQSKTDTLNIGAYIKGDIKVSVYGVSLNFIGGTPNIVGNILNEGNTVGLFTAVQMVKSNSSNSFISKLPPSQYLGDLSVDSPLPFSIPINMDNKTLATIKPGIHPIALKITYSDDLKIPHQLIVNSSIDYQPSQSQTKGGGSHGGIGLFGFKIGNMISFPAIIVIIAIVVILLLLFVRRIRSRRSRKRSKSQVSTIEDGKDMELFLDDISPSPSPSSPSPSSQSSSQQPSHTSSTYHHSSHATSSPPSPSPSPSKASATDKDSLI